MCAPTLADVTRSIAILEHWKDNWLEKHWLGCSVDRWLENRTWADVLAWVDENESQHDSDCGFFIRYCLDIGLHSYGAGVGNYIATGTYFEPSLYDHPTVEGRNDALINRSGIYADGHYYDFDHLKVAEDVTHSFYNGDRALHPWEGETDPIDPERGKAKASTRLRNRPGTTSTAAAPVSRWRRGHWRGASRRRHPAVGPIRTSTRCSRT